MSTISVNGHEVNDFINIIFTLIIISGSVVLMNKIINKVTFWIDTHKYGKAAIVMIISLILFIMLFCYNGRVTITLSTQSLPVISLK